MSLTLISGGTGGTHDQVNKVRVSWIEQIEFMTRSSEPLLNTLLRKLRNIAEGIAADEHDTPQILVFTTKATSGTLSLLIDIFLIGLPMYGIKSILPDHANNEFRYVLVFELRDNNDAWIVEQMKASYKAKLQSSLVQDLELDQQLPEEES